MTFIEYIFLNNLRNRDSHITLINAGILSQIINNKKPVIFVSTFCKFELMSMEITKKSSTSYNLSTFK